MRVDIDVRGVDEITGNLNNFVVYISTKYVNEVLRNAHRYAIRISPKDTGALQRAIYSDKTSTIKGFLRLRRPMHKDGRERDYHLWQHGIGRYDISEGKYSPKTGDPRFMETTATYMQTDIIKKFDKRFKESFR